MCTRARVHERTRALSASTRSKSVDYAFRLCAPALFTFTKLAINSNSVRNFFHRQSTVAAHVHRSLDLIAYNCARACARLPLARAIYQFAAVDR